MCVCLTDTDVSLGLNNSPGGLGVLLRGKTHLNNDDHDLMASGTFNQNFGGKPIIGADLNYLHVPSSEYFKCSGNDVNKLKILFESESCTFFQTLFNLHFTKSANVQFVKVIN